MRELFFGLFGRPGVMLQHKCCSLFRRRYVTRLANARPLRVWCYAPPLHIAGAMLMALLLFGACNKAVPIPEPSLPEAKMVAILTDMHLVEAAIQNCPATLDRDSFAVANYAYLLKLHQIDRQTLDDNMKAYLSEPQRAKNLYAKVTDTLSQMQGARPYEPGVQQDFERQR